MGRKNHGRMSVELAVQLILKKYLRKGNMARAMRDILPGSGLSYSERDKVARIVHQVVRLKKLYDYVLGREGRPEEYISLVNDPERVEKFAEKARREGRYDVYFSSSSEVAKVIIQHEDFATQINREAETHLAVNLVKTNRDKVLETLREEKICTRRCYPETCVVAESHARYSAAVKNGLAIVQDASSQQVAKVVASLGNNILDYCAGSGGKSFTIKFFNPEADVHVHDANENRLEKLFNRAEILGFKFQRFNFNSKHQVVLVDAPCSGLGSSARNPEAKYRSDLDSFPPLQMEILRKAKEFVTEDGYLVYVVCTFNPEETHKVVEKFLHHNANFEEFQISGNLRAERLGGYFTDGDIMYIAILHRR